MLQYFLNCTMCDFSKLNKMQHHFSLVAMVFHVKLVLRLCSQTATFLCEVENRMVKYKTAGAPRFSCLLEETQEFETICINLEPLIPASLSQMQTCNLKINWAYNILHICPDEGKQVFATQGLLSKMVARKLSA